MNYFITAIGTDSGKTVASAILTEALHADYWKPIQAGLPKDSEAVRALISNSETRILPEKYCLQTPASPHYAAEVDGVILKIADFELPTTNKEHLVIEGAGGILVPLNDTEFIIDLVKHLKSKIILVANLYLGSINHTLLSLEALKKRNLKPLGIIFNGEANSASESIILKHAAAPCILRIAQEAEISQLVIKKYAKILKSNLHELG